MKPSFQIPQLVSPRHKKSQHTSFSYILYIMFYNISFTNQLLCQTNMYTKSHTNFCPVAFLHLLTPSSLHFLHYLFVLCHTYINRKYKTDHSACGMQLQDTKQKWTEGEDCLATISNVCCMVTIGFHFSLLQDNAVHTTEKTRLPYLVSPTSSTGINNWNALWIYELLLDAYKLNKQNYTSVVSKPLTYN